MKAIVAVVTLALLGSSADELATTDLGRLTIKAPAAWKKTDNEGTLRFAAPSGEAYFEIDVGQVARPGGMPAAECLGKITTGIGGDFEKLTIGKQPAAKQTATDTDEDGKSFITYTFVGCDGQTTWSMTFHTVDAKKERYGALADKVAKSITYVSKGK